MELPLVLGGLALVWMNARNEFKQINEEPKPYDPRPGNQGYADLGINTLNFPALAQPLNVAQHFTPGHKQAYEDSIRRKWKGSYKAKMDYYRTHSALRHLGNVARPALSPRGHGEHWGYFGSKGGDVYQERCKQFESSIINPMYAPVQ